MIDLVAPYAAHEAAADVFAAFARSVSATQIRWISPAAINYSSSDILVAIDPTADLVPHLRQWLREKPRKLILLGQLPEELSHQLGLQTTAWPENLEALSRSPQAPTYGFAESPATIRYTAAAEGLGGAQWHRPLERFDFTDEWNNLGYGAVRADGSIWGLSAPLIAPEQNALAQVECHGGVLAAYCALFDDTTSSILWYNRATGPIDSFEWRLIEVFLASWRHTELPCQPILQEIPWGHDAAVTMRLDCDEDVESARFLMDAYRDMRIPFSLAVHTVNLDDPRHYPIMKEVLDGNGSILSHTATHAPNWGGSYEAALWEGKESAKRIQSVTGIRPRYTVSPFHQSPHYALAALVDTGYDGCIGGIIRNDPEFLLARGGHLAQLPEGFVGHSQQCMLHGDCLLDAGDPMTIFKAAFDQALQTRTLFGYLDHPFSSRYQYGWPDQDTCTASHRTLVEYIRNRSNNPVFLSEDDAMDFLWTKARWQATEQDGRLSLVAPKPDEVLSSLVPTIEYRGQLVRAEAGVLPS